MSARRQVVSLAVVISAFGVIGCGPNPSAQPTTAGGGTPPGPSNPPSSTTPAVPKQGEDKAEFTLTIAEYKAEYQKNRDNTFKKYISKVVEVSGRLKEYRPTTKGFEAVINSPDEELCEFHCMMKDGTPWTTALPGQMVKVRGKVTIPAGALSLEDGVLVSATGDGPATVAATEVAKQYKADEDGYKKKHPIGSPLILTGEIVSVENHEPSNSVVATVASEANGAAVKCYFNNLNTAQKERNAKLAKGQKVKVLGHDRSLLGCQFNECVLLEEKK